MTSAFFREMIAARPKSFALVALVAVLNVALYLFIGQWQGPELARAQKEWMAKREAIAAGQSPSVAVRYRATARDLALFRQRLLTKEAFPAFLGRLFETAHNDKLSITGVTYRPAAVKQDPSLVSYEIGFSLSGGYPAEKRFIADLARFPEIMSLDNVALQSSGPTQASVGLNLKLTVFLRMEGA